jgi:hypothetical protein
MLVLATSVLTRAEATSRQRPIAHPCGHWRLTPAGVVVSAAGVCGYMPGEDCPTEALDTAGARLHADR